MTNIDDEYETPEKTRMRNEWMVGKHGDSHEKIFDIGIPKNSWKVDGTEGCGYIPFTYQSPKIDNEVAGKIGGKPHSDGSRLNDPLKTLEMYAKSGMIGDLRIVDENGKPLQLNKKEENRDDTN